MKPEETIEKYLCEQIEKIGGLCWKWVCPSRQGVPDRIIMCCNRIWLVECKRPGGKPRDLQDWTHKLILNTGNVVWIIDTKYKVDQFVEMLKSIV